MPANNHAPFKHALACAAACAACGLAGESTAADYKVYVLTGQSNSLGTTNLEGLDSAPGSHPADAQTAFFWSNVNASNGVYPANLYGDSGGAITTLQTQQGDGGANGTFWGPEFGFARSLYDTDLIDGTQDDNVLIIKASRGGGGNTFWDKGAFEANNNSGHMWGHVRDTVDAGLAALDGQGHTFSVAGMMYLQGESNSAGEAAIADTRLDALTTNLRDHINAGYAGAADDMRLVIGEIAASQSTASRQTTTSKQQGLAAGNPGYSFVATADLALKSDNIHFGRDAKLEIGERFAAAMTALTDPPTTGGPFGIVNPSFETGDALDAVEANPPAGWEALGAGMFHSNAAPPNQSLNDFGGAYADNANGLDGEEMAFNTSTGGIAGSGLAQTLGSAADDHTVYRMTVGVGDRNFFSRYAGVTLELRLEDDTVLASRFFDTDDVSPLLTNGGAAALGEVVDLTAVFTLGDVDNAQNLRIAIIAGGATEAADGGALFGQSLDIDHVRLISHAPGDADADGDIDDTDLGLAISNFTGPAGTAGGKTAAQGDTDGDGDVDDTDIGVMISGFTGPLAPAAVPEPASIGLLGLPLLVCGRRRRGPQPT